MISESIAGPGNRRGTKGVHFLDEMPSHPRTKLASGIRAGGILISSGELANSFIQTFISWRICYSQVAVSQIALLCLVPHPFYPSLSPSPPPPHTISEGLGGIEENIIVSHSLWSQNSNYFAIRRQYVLGIGRASYIESYFARVNCTIHVSHLEETE